MKFVWERLGDYCFRAKVIGGWLVRHHYCDTGSILFIPDPNHEWSLELE